MFTHPITLPFFTLSAVNQHPALEQAFQRVLDSSHYILGSEIMHFEEEFAQYQHVNHAIGVANGTDAIELALRAVGVIAGNKVATVANAGFYASTAIHAIGATPVYVDVDGSSLTMSPTSLQAVFAAHPAAVIVTHLYGQMADMSTLMRLCRQEGIPLIEDCAQAHGAIQHERKAGSWGTTGCFSFYPTKNLGALGDAGAIVTDDDTIATKIRALRQYGWQQKYTINIPGGKNSRMDEIQAAFLRAKLPLLDQHNQQRQAIAQLYREGLSHLPLQLPPAGDQYVAHLFVVRSPKRNALAAYLRSVGIGCDIHYPIADHLQPIMDPVRQVNAPLPVTERACAQVLSLPCHPGLSHHDVHRVICAIHDFHGLTKGETC